MNDIIKVIVFSISSYVFLFIIAKLLGKKQIAQLSFIDYVVGITIGSIAAEMSTETEQPFYHYLIAMSIFFLFDMAISFLGRKTAFLKKIITGKPLLIINNGQIDYKELKKSKLTVDELAGLARDKNIFDLNDIAYGIFETKGTLSILPKSEKSQPTAENLNLVLPDASLAQYVIIDGKICRDTLSQLGKDEKWLLDKLNRSEESVKEILLAEYDEEKDEFTIQDKVFLEN